LCSNYYYTTPAKKRRNQAKSLPPNVYVVHPVATRIWNLLDGQTDVNQIVEAMCREYDVSPEQAKKDVCEILVSLEKAGLVSASPEGTS